MTVTKLEADYLIVGTGAVGMAFADILLTETDANIIMVDLHHKPGGHWNDAYSFVTLHQPSTFYGVSSKELSKNQLDKVGLNKGLGDLASGAEVSAYFDEVMRHQFLPSGRVQYFPMCRYEGDGNFTSIISGEKFHATAKRKTVDATYLKTTVPSTHTPNFSIAPSVWFMPLNELPKLQKTPDGYVIVGGGKTAIDACIWLLEQGADPDKITWIMPRDAWLLDRRNTQPMQEFFHNTIEAQAAQMESIVASTSIEDMFDKLEACGYFLRIDENVRPKMFHGATISTMELEQLRRIKNIVRMGHVKSIEADKIVFADGSIPTTLNTVHVDCSARAITSAEVQPVFQGDLIISQMVRSYQPVFSAALIAHVEAAYDDEDEKNRLCGVVPLPNDDTDYIKFTAINLMNQYNWSQDKDLRKWLAGNRLDGMSDLILNIKEDEKDKIAVLQRLRSNAPKAAEKLFGYLAQLDADA